MKKVVPNFKKLLGGTERAMMIPEPGAPQPKKVYLINESAASQQYVRKSSIMPPAMSPILPLLSPYSTISISSLLQVTPEFSSSVTKDLRQKGRKYVSSFSTDESSSSNSDEEDSSKIKPSAGMEVLP